MQELVAKLEFHVMPIVQNLELDLWGIEILPGAKTLVRVYLEKAGIDECTQVSRLLGLVLDVEEIFSDAWVLEVSTPGLDRSFFSLEQMKGYTGQTLLVNLFQPIIQKTDKKQVRRKITGELLSVNEDSFDISTLDTKEVFSVEFENVKKAKLVPTFEELEKPITKQENTKFDADERKNKAQKAQDFDQKLSKNDKLKMQRLLARVVEPENTLSYDEEEIAKIFKD